MKKAKSYKVLIAGFIILAIAFVAYAVTGSKEALVAITSLGMALDVIALVMKSHEIRQSKK